MHTWADENKWCPHLAHEEAHNPRWCSKQVEAPGELHWSTSAPASCATMASDINRLHAPIENKGCISAGRLGPYSHAAHRHISIELVGGPKATVDNEEREALNLGAWDKWPRVTRVLRHRRRPSHGMARATTYGQSKKDMLYRAARMPAESRAWLRVEASPLRANTSANAPKYVQSSCT